MEEDEGGKLSEQKGIGKDRGSKVREVSMYPHVSHTLSLVLEGLGAARSQRAGYGDSENVLAPRGVLWLFFLSATVPLSPPPPLV